MNLSGTGVWIGLGVASGLCALGIVYGGSAMVEGADDPLGYLIALHQRWPAFLALDGLPLLLGWVGWLVGQLRHREEALASLQTTLGSLSDGALARTLLDAVLLADADGRIVATNLAARQLYGENLLGLSIHDVLVDLARSDSNTTERRDPEGQLLGLQWHLTAKRADGHFVPVRVTCGPASGHRVIYILGQDAHAGDPPQPLASAIRERDRARAALSAHHALLRALAAALGPELARLHELPQATETASRVEDALDWCQLEAGKITLQREPCFLSPLFDAVRARTQHLTSAHGVVLLFCGGPLALHADGPRLVRILTLILRQLCRQGITGAVRIIARPDTEDPRMVHIEIAPSTGQLALTLEGPLYDPQGQLEIDRLGLRVAHRLVAAMGGSLQLPRPDARGRAPHAAVHLRLPAIATQLTLIPEPDEPTLEASGRPVSREGDRPSDAIEARQPSLDG